MTRWYDGVSAATAPVRCGDEVHRVTWRRGRVVLEDHDVAAEAALAALGGERCPCLEVLDACRAGFGVDDLFPLWTEPAEPVGATGDLERWARRAGAGALPPGVVGRRRRLAEERRSAIVASLPLGFRRRLALGVFRALARRPDTRATGDHPGFAPLLTSLLGRAARASLPAPASGGPVDVRWALVGPGEAAAADGRLGPRGGWLRLAVSAGWVADVWAWDLDRVDGHLVVEVTGRPARNRAEVRLVHWSASGRPRLVPAAVVRRPGSPWCPTGDPAHPGRLPS